MPYTSVFTEEMPDADPEERDNGWRHIKITDAARNLNAATNCCLYQG